MPAVSSRTYGHIEAHTIRANTGHERINEDISCVEEQLRSGITTIAHYEYMALAKHTLVLRKAMLLLF